MRVKMKEEKEYDMEEGVHYATITNFEMKDTQYGESLLAHFVVVVGDHKGRFVNSFVGTELTPDSKLATWATKILNREIQIDEELELNEMVGKPARIFVKMNKKGYYNVDDVLSIKSKNRKKLKKLIEKFKQENSDYFENENEEVEKLEEDLENDLDEEDIEDEELEEEDLDEDIDDEDLDEELEDELDEEDFNEDELMEEIEEIE